MSSDFWAKGPKVDMLHGLVNSGVISATTMIPKLPRLEESPEKSRENTSTIVKCTPSKITSRSNSCCRPPKILSAPLKLSTTVHLQPNYKPQPLVEGTQIKPPVILPPESGSFPAILARDCVQKKCTRAESKDLLSLYEEVVSQVSTANYDNMTALQQYDVDNQLISANLLVLDQSIKLVKTYNNDIALVIFKIKNFFQDICEQVPTIAKKAEEEKKVIMNHNTELWEQAKKMEEDRQEIVSEKDQLRKDLQKMTEKYNKSEMQLHHLEAAINDLQYNNTELTQKADELILRYTKVSEQKTNLMQTIHQLEGSAESNTKMIKQQEDIINKYEEEGASFKPMYQKAAEELHELKKKNKLVMKQFEIATSKDKYVDVGVDAIPLVVQTKKPNKKKGKASNHTMSASSSFHESEISHKYLPQVTSQNPSAQLPKDNPLTVSLTVTPKIEPIKNVNSTENTNKLEEAAKTVEIEEVVVKEMAVDDVLPPGYVVELFFDENTPMTNYVDCLLAMPPNHSDVNSISQGDTFSAGGEEKSFSWTLRQVITVFRSGFENDSLYDCDTSFRNIVFNLLIDQCQHTKIVDRIQCNINTSVLAHREKSKAMQFYLRFASGEYSVIKFRFFVMLFNMLFKKIYPNIEDIIEDPELYSDINYFTIHISYASLIAKTLLRTNQLPNEAINELLMSSPNIQYPKMVSFWELAEVLINEFEKAHATFHVIIKNSLVSVGWSDSDFICKDNFYDFLHIVFPFITDQELKERWQNALSQIEDSGNEVVPRLTFLKYCGAAPQMASSIFQVPSLPDFEKKLMIMPQPLIDLFLFLKGRYCSFIPNLLAQVGQDISSLMRKSVVRVRNGIMNCDISTTIMHYSHILQIVDLKCTESQPLLIVTSNTTTNDAQRLQNQLMMRECLAAQHLFITINKGINVLQKEKELAKYQ